MRVMDFKRNKQILKPVPAWEHESLFKAIPLRSVFPAPLCWRDVAGGGASLVPSALPFGWDHQPLSVTLPQGGKGASSSVSSFDSPRMAGGGPVRQQSAEDKGSPARAAAGRCMSRSSSSAFPRPFYPSAKHPLTPERPYRGTGRYKLRWCTRWTDWWGCDLCVVNDAVFPTRPSAAQPLLLLLGVFVALTRCHLPRGADLPDPVSLSEQLTSSAPASCSSRSNGTLKYE